MKPLISYTIKIEWNEQRNTRPVVILSLLLTEMFPDQTTYILQCFYRFGEEGFLINPSSSAPMAHNHV